MLGKVRRPCEQEKSRIRETPINEKEVSFYWTVDDDFNGEGKKFMSGAAFFFFFDKIAGQDIW